MLCSESILYQNSPESIHGELFLNSFLKRESNVTSIVGSFQRQCVFVTHIVHADVGMQTWGILLLGHGKLVRPASRNACCCSMRLKASSLHEWQEAYHLPDLLNSDGCDHMHALIELPRCSLETPVACGMSHGVLRGKTAAACLQCASSLGQEQFPSLVCQQRRISATAACLYQMLQNLPTLITSWLCSSCGLRAASRCLSAAVVHSCAHAIPESQAWPSYSHPENLPDQHCLFGAVQAIMK